ncbi:hypothetical protein PROVRETT_07098 [Providencia rettgeri DSM 1131]|uniref:hypothetical protein n=1 Tax=Providencia rettgeri TaxID=587 RepID=UPI000197C00F|nr:hypothetical protein [Providencia rettgeri]EFE54102.1 hypothetical protein PROVRETT_07098 [Providencia rettgeri DSM 1131]QXA57397.1 hypothetical protein I6L79_18855 [Providencia rettgeri]
MHLNLTQHKKPLARVKAVKVFADDKKSRNNRNENTKKQHLIFKIKKDVFDLLLKQINSNSPDLNSQIANKTVGNPGKTTCAFYRQLTKKA